MLEKAQRNALGVIAITLLVIVFLLLLWQVAHVLLLTFAGLLFAVLLLSIADPLRRHTPLGRTPAILVVLLLITGLLFGVGWLIGPRLASQFNQLSSQISQPLQQLEETLAQYRWGDAVLRNAPLLEAPTDSAGAAPQEPAQTTAPGSGQADQAGPALPGNLASRVMSIFSTIISSFADFIFIVVAGVFFAAGAQMYQSGVVRLFPHERRERAREVLDELFLTLQRWLLGQLISMTIVGVLTGLGLWLIGIPLVLVLAFIAFLLEFIPLIGPWLAGVPAVLLAFTQGPTQALWVLLLYVVVQQLEGNVILPLVQERTVYLPPVLTLVAIFVGGSLFGLLGLLVATPLVAVILVLVKMLYLRDTLGDEVDLPGKRGVAGAS